MTPLQRRLLLHARMVIEKGHHDRICWALNEARVVFAGHSDANTDVELLKWHIRCQLQGECALEYWQQARGIHHTPEQCRQDRLDWINWMLGEL